MDPGQERAGGEGFGDVVVGADAQSDQHVDLVGAGGQHQHVAAAECAQLAAHLDAVHPGKAQVEHDQVRFGLPGQHQGRLTVACGAHLEAVLQQVPLDHPHQAGLVIDNQSGQLLNRRHGQASSFAMKLPCHVWYQTAPVVAFTDSMPTVCPPDIVSIV